MFGSRKFCQRGSNSDNVFFFLVDQGREDQNITKSGPLLARQENLIKWCFADGQKLNSGLVFQRIWTSIAKKPYILWFFRGSGPPVAPPPLDPPVKLSFKISAFMPEPETEPVKQPAPTKKALPPSKANIPKNTTKVPPRMKPPEATPIDPPPPVEQPKAPPPARVQEQPRAPPPARSQPRVQESQPTINPADFLPVCIKDFQICVINMWLLLLWVKLKKGVSGAWLLKY